MKDDVMRLLNDGFFDGVDFGEDITAEKIQSLWEMFGGRKYQMKYYLMHHDIMPTWGVPDEALENPEKVYKECLESGKTWQEYTGYKKVKKGVLW